ncbi:MAG: DUF6174 domain-containing protein [Actinomycetota bacterium]
MTLTIAGALLLSACGGDGGETTVAGPDGTTQPIETPTPGPTPTPTPPPGGNVDEQGLADLADARARWAAAGIGEYAYSIVESCECDPETVGPRRVTVSDGVVVSTTWFGSPSQYDGVAVEVLFDQIELGLQRGEVTNRVTYDDATGAPVDVLLDEEAVAADGGRAFNVQAFISYDSLRADLDAARDRWAAAGIDGYVVTYDQVCFCPQLQVEVTVVNGEVVASEVRSEVDLGDVPTLTVEAMFAEIEAQIDAGAFSVSADYDPVTGHPTGYFVDVEEMMADEEFGIAGVTVEQG